jgi:TatD DNase family protein
MPVIDMHTHVHRLLREGQAWPAYLVCCGTRPEDWDAVSSWCRDRAGVVPAYGIHPWFAERGTSEVLARLEKRLQGDSRACVGEIGLHYTKSFRNDAEQRALFHRQLELGISLERCISIHCVHAWGDLLASLDRFPLRGARLVVHDFYGSLEVAHALIRRGVYLSFGMRPDRPRQAALLAALPLEFLLVESDAGGGDEETAYDGRLLQHTIERMARLRGVDAGVLSEILYANGLRVLGAI